MYEHMEELETQNIDVQNSELDLTATNNVADMQEQNESVVEAEQSFNGESTEQLEEQENETVLEQDQPATEQVAEQEEVAAEEVAEQEPAKTEQELRIEKAQETAMWYALHTFTGYENVAKENLETVIENFNLYERIFDIIIPMEDAVEEKNGKRKIVSRKVMPGYIFVKMNYGDDIWHAVTRTRGVTGFVGPKGRPLPLRSEEIRKMKLEDKVVADISIDIDDKVEVLDGPLSGFTGVVISVDAVSFKCRVMVEMFGRETPVDLNLTQIRKLA